MIIRFKPQNSTDSSRPWNNKDSTHLISISSNQFLQMSTTSSIDDDDIEIRESGWLREARHNPCLMRPVSALVMFILMLVSAITMLLYIPSFVLGFLVSPLARRTAWFIEFFYPFGIARWGHFLLVKSASKSKHSDASAGHSRTIEQRFEIVKGRVYIHMLPQLLDNIAYLVVCVPPSTSSLKTIVAFLVDCGDATAALNQMFEIRDVHYPDYEIDLQAVLCTHKHHDHTAGNAGLLASDLVNVQQVVGGAVEKVPHANTLVANGDVLRLPSVDGNDMNELVQVEVMAMPAHTRGSVVYAMRVNDDEEGSIFLFAGDTMFSGGGGVPFEADTETPGDQRLSNKNGSSHVKPSAGSKATERCFAEIIYRGTVNGGSTDGMIVLPGHEYTSDLIARQFRSGGAETSSWKQMPPAVFFETASEYYIASHRRALPHNGKLLTVPSVVSRELYINPHYRSLKKRGDHIIRALRMWYRHFSKEKISGVDHSLSLRSPSSVAFVPKLNDSNKTPSTETEWNVTTDDITRPIFTTVYAADLESVIDELNANKITPQKAAKRLRAMQASLDENVIGRRPIPGTLPTNKGIYQGILALAILGSGPCAMTLGDSEAMNLPVPMDRNSDCILISKTRLITVLNGLELLTPANDGSKLVQMIELLWKDASEYCDSVEWAEVKGAVNDCDESFEIENGLERTIPDEIELGILKWCIYGAQANHPSWFTKFCMLTSDEIPQPREMPVHPVKAMNVRRTNGELVRHDVLRCPLCRDATGCPEVDYAGDFYATSDDSPRRESSLAGLPEESASAVSSEIEMSAYTRMESEVSLPFDENGSDAELRQSVIKPMLTEA